MSISAYIPTYWRRMLLENLRDAHVFGKLCSSEYEGEIKAEGDTVKIFTVGRPTISTYTKNSSSLTYERLQIAEQTLTIDTGRSFSFKVDDVDKVQTKASVMEEATREAAWGLSDASDAAIAAAISAGVATSSPDQRIQAGNDLVVGSGPGDYNAFEMLVDLNTLLTEQNTPATGRVAVVPPWFASALLKDPRFSSFGTPSSMDNMKNGIFNLTEVMFPLIGMRVHISNNVTVTGTGATRVFTINAWHPSAVAFAEQIPIGMPEAVRIQEDFSDALRGLYLFGHKVLRPNNIVALDCLNGAA